MKSLPFHILHWNWHSLHLNIIPYKFCIKWLLPPFKHTISLNFLRDSDTFFYTRDFFANTTGWWKAHSCHKYSIHTNSALQYYAVWTFYQFSCSLIDCLSTRPCISSLYRNAKFFSDSFVRNISCNIHIVYNMCTIQ